MKRKITLAAYLVGVTTLAVSLPAMADPKGQDVSGVLGARSGAATADEAIDMTRDRKFD